MKLCNFSVTIHYFVFAPVNAVTTDLPCVELCVNMFVHLFVIHNHIIVCICMLAHIFIVYAWYSVHCEPVSCALKEEMSKSIELFVCLLFPKSCKNCFVFYTFLL